MKNLSEQGRENQQQRSQPKHGVVSGIWTQAIMVGEVVTATPTLQQQKCVEKFIKLETVENATVLNEKIKNKRLKHYKKV